MKRFMNKIPSKEGTFEMKDGNKKYIIFVEQIGDRLSFREKGQPFLYDLNSVKHCKFRKI